LVEPLVFESPDAATEPLPFTLIGKRQHRDDDGKVVSQEPEAQEFHAEPAVSYGVLLDDLLGDRGSDSDGTWQFFETCLVKRNSHPDDDDEHGPDDRTEFERFRDFVTDPELFFHPDTIIAVARRLTEQATGRPTELPGASRSTRRSAGRGSTRKR